MEIKSCSKCGATKPICDFPIVYGRERKDGTRKERIHSQCRGCRYSICKSWHDKNPDYSLAKKKEWEVNNAAHVKEYRKEYRSVNSERVKGWKKEWDAKNHLHILEYNKKRYPEIKDKVRVWNRKTSVKMRSELKDCYVIYTLSKKIGLKAKELREYPDLIQSQRLIIKTHRLCKTSQN